MTPALGGQFNPCPPHPQYQRLVNTRTSTVNDTLTLTLSPHPQLNPAPQELTLNVVTPDPHFDPDPSMDTVKVREVLKHQIQGFSYLTIFTTFHPSLLRTTTHLPHGELRRPHVLQQEPAGVVPPGRPVDEEAREPHPPVKHQGCLVVFFNL